MAASRADADPSAARMAELLSAIRACAVCPGLALGPRPLVQAHARARILVAGHAPGRRAHVAGRLFADPSGDRLRTWLGVSSEEFRDPRLFAIAPMGFCYPGTGAAGDMAPRPECAPLWRTRLLAQMREITLTIVIGRHAQAWHLPGMANLPLGEAVRSCAKSGKGVLLMPHPSPRNNRWLRVNPWFELEVLPQIRKTVRSVLRPAM